MWERGPAALFEAGMYEVIDFGQCVHNSVRTRGGARPMQACCRARRGAKGDERKIARLGHAGQRYEEELGGASVTCGLASAQPTHLALGGQHDAVKTARCNKC